MLGEVISSDGEKGKERKTEIKSKSGSASFLALSTTGLESITTH